MILLQQLLEAVIDKRRMLQYQQEAIDGLDDPEWDVSLSKVTSTTLGFLKPSEQRGIKSNMALYLTKEGCPKIAVILPKAEGGVIIVVRALLSNEPYIAWYSSSRPFSEQMKDINFTANVLSLKAALLHEFDRLTITKKHELTTRDTITFTGERVNEPAISVVMNSKFMDYAVTTTGKGEHRFKTEAQAIAQVRKFIALNKTGE